MMKKLRIIVGLALLNLRRSLRRTLLTASALIVGGALLITSLSLGDGSHEKWIDSGVRIGTGHVTIENPEFRTRRLLDNRLPNEVRNLVQAAFSIRAISEHISSVSVRLIVKGLISSAAGARPTQIVGVDPTDEAEFSALDEQVVEGRYLVPDDRFVAYIGVGLAESLNLRLGSKFVATTQDTNGEIVGQLLRVVGIFRSGVTEIDRTLIHIPILAADEWLELSGDVTSISILVKNSDVVPVLVDRLSRGLSGPISDEIITIMEWREAMPELNDAIELDDFGNYVIHGILFVIIGFGIVNTVLMSVLHRRREFGVLQAIGLAPGQTGILVLIEGLILTITSGTIGVVLGVLVTWYVWGDGLDLSGFVSNEFSFSGFVVDPVIFPLFRQIRLIQAFVFILIIGGMASIYPAFRASKLDVAEAMKFER